MTRLSIKPQRFHGYFLAALMLAAIFGIISISIKQVHAATAAEISSAEHIITLHDDGTEIGFITDAKTLREAFKNEGIRLDENDRTEPGLDDELVARSYEVNIYRARPVIVRTNGTETRIITAYRTARQIAEQAGLKLQAEDKPVLSPSRDIIVDGASAILTVDYATAFNFEFYGKKMTAYTQADTVSDMLREKGITPQAQDEVKPSLSSPIVSGMTVQLWRNGEQTITVDEDVPFETETIKDVNREKSFKEIKTPGVDGRRTVTYKIVMKDGIEVSRETLNSVTLKESVKQVEIIGAKLPTPTNPTEAQALGRQMMLDFGYDEGQWPCLYNLWMRESGWRTTAGNPTSGAYGIPQSLPASKMAKYGDDYLTNASVQITWGLNYIKGRYQTPCGAWDSFLAKGWY